MNYKETLNWMFRQLPMYQNVGKSAYKKDLSNSLKLAGHLGNPHSTFKSIHVAGTNGKGSVCHMLASILFEAGYKVGLYTSPHLKDFRERIKINGEMVSKDFVVEFIGKNKSFFQQNQLSFFEMTVGMAYQYFSQENVDIAIVEVGLGGRLDSTNIINPEVSVITNIGLDHTAMLGNTSEAIAAEKAGIIKSAVPVVIGETQKKTKPVFIKHAEERGASITFADKIENPEYKSDLVGRYQSKNKKTVIATIDKLRELKYKVDQNHIKKGLLNVVANTSLLGRWQILQHSPKVICDTAHNKEGLVYVIEQLVQEEYKRLHIVFGTVKDKDLNSILEILPVHADYYLCQPTIDRRLPIKLLQEKFNRYNFKNAAFESVRQAYRAALKDAANDDIVFVGGSTFVVAEIL